jgi:hypothetical protein
VTVTFFRFEDTWTLPAPARHVYKVLADLACYTDWWPQVRRARQLSADTGELVIRSVLPYSLRVVIRPEIEDPERLLLRATLTGDMVGWSSWQISPSPDGCTGVFTQEVTTNGLLSVAALVARPLLEWNHAIMMRNGQRELQAYLSRSSDANCRPERSPKK